jgi:hypothetical protein
VGGVTDLRAGSEHHVDTTEESAMITDIVLLVMVMGVMALAVGVVVGWVVGRMRK